MTMAEHVETTSDERVMAGISHFFGLIAALIVWATQKDKSRFVRFQALQALAFDMVFMLVYMLFMMGFVGIMFVAILAIAVSTARSASGDPLFPGMLIGMLMPFGMLACVMPPAVLAMLIRIVAALSVATGHNFRYPLIASRVDAFLKEPASAA